MTSIDETLLKCQTKSNVMSSAVWVDTSHEVYRIQHVCTRCTVFGYAFHYIREDVRTYSMNSILALFLACDSEGVRMFMLIKSSPPVSISRLTHLHLFWTFRIRSCDTTLHWVHPVHPFNAIMFTDLHSHVGKWSYTTNATLSQAESCSYLKSVSTSNLLSSPLSTGNSFPLFCIIYYGFHIITNVLDFFVFIFFFHASFLVTYLWDRTVKLNWIQLNWSKVVSSENLSVFIIPSILHRAH